MSDDAFIRPSPSAGRLGGVTPATRESIVVLEAAGFDVVFVETVGVGQSEIAVAGMVDTFLLLMLARTGDSLQGIKKGVLELADVIAINKADGDRASEAEGAAKSCRRHCTSSPGHRTAGIGRCSRAAPGRSAGSTRCGGHRGPPRPSGALRDLRRKPPPTRRRLDVGDDRGPAAGPVPGLADGAWADAALEEAVRAGELTPTAAATELLDLDR